MSLGYSIERLEAHPQEQSGPVAKGIYIFSKVEKNWNSRYMLITSGRTRGRHWVTGLLTVHFIM